MRIDNTIEWLLIAIMISLIIDIVTARHHHHLAHQHQQQQQQRQHHQQQQQQLQEQHAHSKQHSKHFARRQGRAAATTSSWLGPELMVARRVYEDCQDKNDFIGCLKQKALIALSRALEQDSIKIVDGLVLEKQNTTEKESIISSLTDARTLNTLSPIDRALLAKVDKFTRTHTLKMDMSQGRGHHGGGGGGGGGSGYGGSGHGGGGGGGGHKNKKGGGGGVKYVIAALLTAMGIAGPIGLKALAAIATKALVISKVALTIASIIALKKLFSHDHHEESSFQVHAGDHNRRNTFVIRPVNKANPPTAIGAVSQYSDPYRYYYEYH